MFPKVLLRSFTQFCMHCIKLSQKASQQSLHVLWHYHNVESAHGRGDCGLVKCWNDLSPVWQCSGCGWLPLGFMWHMCVCVFMSLFVYPLVLRHLWACVQVYAERMCDVLADRQYAWVLVGFAAPVMWWCEFCWWRWYAPIWPLIVQCRSKQKRK